MVHFKYNDLTEKDKYGIKDKRSLLEGGTVIGDVFLVQNLFKVVGFY